jgi:glycosyltransferase involved in cell wall biosynthesis
MHICLIHNEYGRPSGEEAVVRSIHQLLTVHGHRVTTMMRSSAEFDGSRLGKASAFFTGIYNPYSRSAFRRMLRRERPDIVHVHNLYPLISPSVLIEARAAGVPVVMTVHNYRLVCPNGLHMAHGKLCERCLGGKEYNCVLNNCEGSIFKSLGYAVRNHVARNRRWYRNNVTMYAVLTEFQRRRLIAAGYPAERLMVVPNMVDAAGLAQVTGKGDGQFDGQGGEAGDANASAAVPGQGYVGYVGRISPEKGIPELLAAARSLPEIPFRAAGAFDRMAHLLDSAPANFQFLGHVDRAALGAFYQSSRIIVLCSTCFEGFPTVLVEAMVRSKPVVCSRLGGMPEIVEDGVHGLLIEPGNAEDLARKIRFLWERPELCAQMGAAGQRKALSTYSTVRYHERLMGVYERAILLNARGDACTNGS